MYVHLGQDIVVRSEEIVGIFDIDTTSISKSTRKYLYESEKFGNVINVAVDLPKSFVVCVKDKNKTVYITQISSKTLKKRAKHILE